MTDYTPNLFAILVLVSTIGLVPLIVVTTTGFMKISIVLFIIRNALGIQQTPPNLVLYGIALILTVYVSTPLVGEVVQDLSTVETAPHNVEELKALGEKVREPFQQHLLRYTDPKERAFFMDATSRLWSSSERESVKDDDLMILLPAFVGSELSRAFEIGFLLYIPFLVIDLIVSTILMSMGMMMVSPALISVPLKIFLFVAVDGWSRLMHGLILSYAGG